MVFEMYQIFFQVNDLANYRIVIFRLVQNRRQNVCIYNIIIVLLFHYSLSLEERIENKCTILNINIE